MIRLWPTMLVQPSICHCCSHSPSQNIPSIFAEVKGYFGINNNQLLEFEATIDDVPGRLYDGN
jgi:hypothetical protein